MWIRSQDKERIMKVKEVYLVKSNKQFRLYSDELFLGEYNSQERALEVLDEIQKNIIDSNVTNYEYFYTENQRLLEYTYKLKTVYQMPEE
jgi:hypothetical protein